MVESERKLVCLLYLRSVQEQVRVSPITCETDERKGNRRRRIRLNFMSLVVSLITKEKFF